MVLAQARSKPSSSHGVTLAGQAATNHCCWLTRCNRRMNATTVPRPSAAIEERQVGLQTNYAIREQLLNEGSGGDPISVPNIPLLAIRGWLCVRCLAHKPDLKACSACKRVRYCSERCQKVDWRYLHKHHCKAFRQINLGVDQNAGPQSWGPFCDWLVRYFQRKRERERTS